MRDELEGLINEKLDGIETSIEEVYEPLKEEIESAIENQNKRMEEEKKVEQPQLVDQIIEETEKKDVE